MSGALDSRTSATELLADKLEKPLLDDRSYRVIKLPNELEALLIHDPDTDKASAAMDVNVGSLADPDEMQGMAHAVEHLLFMGTEKYPGENDYNAYLTKFGGYSNAYTSLTHTNYYFELSAKSTSNSGSSSVNNSQTSIPIDKSKAPLYGALDRFSQFFVEPLFLEDTLDRELKAVDSENKKNLQSDVWRLMQLNKSLTSKKHPFSKFSTGNYRLLHDDPIARGVKIRQEFIQFYKEHYSANRMKLVVLGRENLDDLQGWVEEFFSDVYNKQLPQLRYDQTPVQTEDEVRTEIFAKPVMEQRTLELNFFNFPDDEELFESKPSRYISHLIGHEGPGSILAYLKVKGWVDGLSAGSYDVCTGVAYFNIHMRLTTEGLKSYREVVKVVFQYIAMLKEHPPYEWVSQEQSKLAEVAFKFQQKIPASRTTSHVSAQMQKSYPRDWLLSGESLIRKFDPKAIQQGIDALTPENFRLMLVSQDFPGGWNKKEQHYGTEYKYEKIPADFMHEIEVAFRASKSQRPSELYLPGKNEFVPQRLDVEKKEIGQPATAPKLVRHDGNVRLWYKKDDQFWVPKANLYVFLRNPLVGSSPFTTCLTELYRELVEDGLIEYAYDAEIAGLDYSINRVADGLQLRFGGYNDKMHVLLEKVLTSMRDFEVKQERFDIIKERMMRSFRNFEYQEPFRQIHTYSHWLSQERVWTTQQLLEDLPAITADDVQSFFPQILRQMHIETFAHGNLYKEDALRFADLVEGILKPRPLPPSEWRTKRKFLFPPGSDFLYQRTLKNPDNVNHCIEYIVHLGNVQDRELRAKLFLFSQMADEPVFDTLRTKEQLGYICSGGAVFDAPVCAYRILIQSEKDCQYLEQRIDAFYTSFEKTVRDMPQQEFEAHRIGAINKRLEKLKNLGQESGRMWYHISGEMYDFESVHRDAEQIDLLTKDDILDFIATRLSPSSPTRAKTSVHLIAQATSETIAAKMSPTEQREKLAATIAQMLSQLGLETDDGAISAQLEKVDLAGGDVKAIMSAVGRYLVDTAGMAAEQAEQVLAQGQAVLPQLLPSLGIKAPTPADAPQNTASAEEGNVNGGEAEKKTKTVVIEDVKAFKASLPLSAGPRAVQDISVFEELESKL